MYHSMYKWISYTNRNMYDWISCTRHDAWTLETILTIQNAAFCYVLNAGIHSHRSKRSVLLCFQRWSSFFPQACLVGFSKLWRRDVKAMRVGKQAGWINRARLSARLCHSMYRCHGIVVRACIKQLYQICSYICVAPPDPPEIPWGGIRPPRPPSNGFAKESSWQFHRG